MKKDKDHKEVIMILERVGKVVKELESEGIDGSYIDYILYCFTRHVLKHQGLLKKVNEQIELGEKNET